MAGRTVPLVWIHWEPYVLKLGGMEAPTEIHDRSRASISMGAWMHSLKRTTSTAKVSGTGCCCGCLRISSREDVQSGSGHIFCRVQGYDKKNRNRQIRMDTIAFCDDCTDNELATMKVSIYIYIYICIYIYIYVYM